MFGPVLAAAHGLVPALQQLFPLGLAHFGLKELVAAPQVLPTLIRQIEIKKKSIENAERTYEINLEKYRNGNLTGMDLQQFQNQLTTAKQDYTSAIISYKIELLNLKIQTLWDFETHKSYLPVDLLK